MDWRATAIGFMIAALLVVGTLALFNGDAKTSPIARLKSKMGLTAFPSALLVVAGLFWAALFLTLFAAVTLTIVHAVELVLSEETEVTIRGDIILIAGLTATLGAVVALPFTLIRLTLTRDQNRHSEDVLFNEKIAEATRDLYAQWQVTKAVVRGGSYTHHQDFWEDNIILRNAAMDQLERLVEERPATAIGVARMLSVYVRELSKEVRPVSPPDGATPGDLSTWARGLVLHRSDMEKAVQTLGRLRSWAKRAGQELSVKLTGANLQAMGLSNLDFQGADLSWAQLQGADLSWAEFQGADLSWAEFQGANLRGTQLQGADLRRAELQRAELSWAQLQGANLRGAQLQGADLSWAEMDAATNLTAATLRGAMLRFVDCSQVTLSQDQVNSLFGDDTVTLPPDIDPPEWFYKSYDDWGDFLNAWRAWQKEIGFDPDDPATW